MVKLQHLKVTNQLLPREHDRVELTRELGQTCKFLNQWILCYLEHKGKSCHDSKGRIWDSIHMYWMGAEWKRKYVYDWLINYKKCSTCSLFVDFDLIPNTRWTVWHMKNLNAIFEKAPTQTNSRLQRAMLVHKTIWI